MIFSEIQGHCNGKNLVGDTCNPRIIVQQGSGPGRSLISYFHFGTEEFCRCFVGVASHRCQSDLSEESQIVPDLKEEEK